MKEIKLTSLAVKAMSRWCVACYDSHNSGDMSPARVTLEVSDWSDKLVVAGMVCAEARAGRRTKEGHKVLSVIRRGIKLEVRYNNGLPFYIEK